jgi:hypothetical protein
MFYSWLPFTGRCLPFTGILVSLLRQPFAGCLLVSYPAAMPQVLTRKRSLLPCNLGFACLRHAQRLVPLMAMPQVY